MNKNFRTDITKIKEAIDARKLVVLAGAGVSVDSGVPSWRDLVGMMLDRMDLDPKDDLSEPEIAQRYCDIRGHKEYVEDVRQFLKHGEVSSNHLHELIFKLRPEHIVTTNFDDLFEQTILKNSEAYSVVKKDTDLPYCQNRNLVIKIHGDLEEGNFVLNKMDYDQFQEKHILQIAHLQALFATRLVLIIGYQFRDENLQLILRNVTNVLGVHHQMAYMFIPEEVSVGRRKDYWKRGIKVITYKDAEQNGGESISDFLYRTEINTFNTNTIKLEKGKKVAEFLCLLREYSPFDESLRDKAVTEQFEIILLMFSGLRYIPSKSLIKLPLFRAGLKSKLKPEFDFFDLKLTNEKVSDFLINKVIVEPGRAVINKESLSQYKESELVKVNEQLTNFIRLLYDSGVYRVYKAGNKSSDFLDLRRFGQNKNCKCLICLFHRNEFASAISSANMYFITPGSTNENDVEVGYFYYLIGEFKRAKEMFLNIASFAWENKKFLTYYIAIKNLNRLKKLENMFESTPVKSEKIEGEEKKRDERSNQNQWPLMPDFDLDEALLQINPADDFELELFKYIRDDKAIIEAKRKIESTLQSAKEVYFSYLDNPRRIVYGPNYNIEARIAMWHVFSFFTKNRIVGDIYGEFKSICELYVETQIVSYCTHSNYADKLSAFDNFFFIIATNYLNAKHLTSLFLRYNLKQVSFKVSEQKWVLHAAQNFFQSYYKEYNFFDAIGDSSVNQHIGKIYFAQESRRKFNCILLMLAKLSLTQKEFEDLFTTLCKFLERERFLQMNSFSDYFPAFLWQQCENIESEHLDKLQEMFLEDEKYIEDEMVFTFEGLHQKLDRKPIDDMDLLNRLWPERLVGDYLGRSVYVWKIASKSKRKVLSSRLEEFYSKDDKMTNTSLYQFAAREGVFDYEASLEKYVKSVCKQVSVYKKTDGDKYEGTNPRHEFLLAMRLIYSESIDINDPRLAAFHQLKEEYQKFYLNPEGYDHRKFKTDWLLFLEVPEFFERFKKIPQITKKIEAKLKKDFDPKLAEVYYKYFKNKI